MVNDISAAERRAMIAKMVSEQDEVNLSDLVQRFSLTETSIRRDLTILEDQGLVRRVRAGAVPFLQNTRAHSFSEKAKQNLAAKQRIGRVAAEMVRPHDVLLLDCGTTTIQIVKQLPMEFKQTGCVTLMTNSIAISQQMAGFPSPNLILLGGIFLPEYQATVGPQAINQLEDLTTDYVFLGADGISLKSGVTTAHILMAEVDRKMVERARKKVLVLDSSKFSHIGFVPVKPITDFDLIITDIDAPAEIVNAIREMGVEVKTV